MKMPCYLVRDLLPLYHDGVCGKETAADVREHLDGCESCRAALNALDGDTGAEGQLRAERERASADALRKVRSDLRRKRLLPALLVGLAAVALVIGLVLGFRNYARSVQLTIAPEDIAAVTLTEDNALHVTMQDGKSWTAFNASYRTLRVDGQEKEIVLFTMYVDLWSSLFQDGWTDGEEAMLFNDLLDETEEVCYVRWDEWDQVSAATKTEGKGADARDVIDGDAVSGLLHTMWER